MSYAEQIHRALCGAADEEQILWEQANRHSQEYSRVLCLREQDMDRLCYGGVSLPAINLEGETITLTARNVCGPHYGVAGWGFLLMADSPNTQIVRRTGGGTCYLSVLIDEWHAKLVAHLATDLEGR